MTNISKKPYRDIISRKLYRDTISRKPYTDTKGTGISQYETHANMQKEA